MGTPRARITYNAALCRRCGDTVESTYQHHFASCSCGALAVDGGLAYLRRVGNRDDWTELAETVEMSEDGEGGA